MTKKHSFKTSIGGQAVIEGIMMRGPKKSCLAVRRPNGEITREVSSTKQRSITKVPFVRGAVSMIDSMLIGTKYINKSAELSVDEAEPQTKFEAKLEKAFGSKVFDFIAGLATLLGIALAIGLFIYLPILLTSLMKDFLVSDLAKSAVEGVIKIVIFVLYLFAVTRIKDIHRVFEYHGAEHKTIHCYEKGMELTTENAAACSRFHPRCGTSFLFIVLIISIIVGTFIPWDFVAVESAFLSKLLRAVIKIAMLPVVMGVSYEIMRLTGRYDNVITRIVAAPGLWIQRLTTFEPDEKQLEVAISSLLPVLPENEGEDNW